MDFFATPAPLGRKGQVRSLGDRNRRVLAKRAGDPKGSAEACEDLERAHPGIVVCWFPRNTCRGFERDPGFYAWPAGTDPGWMSTTGWVRRHEWYGATAEELAVQLP